MRMFVFGLSALLAATTASMADDAGCAAFKWPVTREQALFAADELRITLVDEDGTTEE